MQTTHFNQWQEYFYLLFPIMQRLQPNFTTDGIRNFMSQQKHRKQPILINGKNIFTYCFQSYNAYNLILQLMA